MTIRLRLTLLYSGILASTLLLFGIVLYSFLQFYLYSDLRSSLKDQTRELQENVKYNPLGWNLFIRLDEFDTAHTGMYIQVINLNNGDRARSINLGIVELPFSQKTLEEKKQGYYVTAKIQNSLFLIYSDPLILNGNVVGVLQSAYNIGVLSEFLSILRALLFFYHYLLYVWLHISGGYLLSALYNQSTP